MRRECILKARRGEIKNFTGYRRSLRSARATGIELETLENSAEENARLIIDYLSRSVNFLSKSLDRIIWMIAGFTGFARLRSGHYARGLKLSQFLFRELLLRDAYLPLAPSK